MTVPDHVGVKNQLYHPDEIGNDRQPSPILTCKNHVLIYLTNARFP